MFVNSSTRVPGIGHVPDEEMLNVNEETEAQGYCHSLKATQQMGRVLLILIRDPFPCRLSELSPQGRQPAAPPPGGWQQEWVWTDLSSCGLTKESRSWISLKQMLTKILEQ